MIGSPYRCGKRMSIDDERREADDREQREQAEAEVGAALGLRRRKDAHALPGCASAASPPSASTSATKPSTLWRRGGDAVEPGRRRPAVERAEPVAPELGVELRQQLVVEVRPVGVDDERPSGNET